MKNRAFTLIELLVVVLIIGILAAIAVPQYQVAVAKSEYSTLKAKTRALAEAVNRYRLATGVGPRKLADLDISFGDVASDHTASTDIEIVLNDGGYCYVWGEYDMVACWLKNSKLAFYYKWEKLGPLYCYTKKDYETGFKVCAQETGKAEPCSSSWCTSGDGKIFYY